MVKFQRVPGPLIVAALTIVICHPLFDFAVMRILVTCLAIMLCVFEMVGPFLRNGFLIVMAAITRYRLVGSRQRKFTAIVLSNSEAGGSKTLNSVTSFALAFTFRLNKITVMEITMAVGAESERKLAARLAAAVTFFARQFFVHAAQRIFRLVMIEVLVVDVSPARSCVAPGAIRSQSSIVRVFVTSAAFTKLETRKMSVACVCSRCNITQLWMTLGTLYFDMLSCKRKLCFFMVEPARGLPALRCVTILALTSELRAMFIEMAAGTLLGQAEVGSGKIFLGLG